MPWCFKSCRHFSALSMLVCATIEEVCTKTSSGTPTFVANFPSTKICHSKFRKRQNPPPPVPTTRHLLHRSPSFREHLLPPPSENTNSHFWSPPPVLLIRIQTANCRPLPFCPRIGPGFQTGISTPLTSWNTNSPFRTAPSYVALQTATSEHPIPPFSYSQQPFLPPPPFPGFLDHPHGGLQTAFSGQPRFSDYKQPYLNPPQRLGRQTATS